jgi:hypothetical protein
VGQQCQAHVVQRFIAMFLVLSSTSSAPTWSHLWTL